MIRVQKMQITKFRNFSKDSIYEIGPCITLIAGINGTSKSTLLGMIAQPLGFPDKEAKDSVYTRAYDGIDLNNLKTVSGKPFKASYSDVFRISQRYDLRREHEYKIFLTGDLDKSVFDCENGMIVRSEGRNDQDKNKLRFVANSHKRTPGWGNFPHPVIYLGLERLRPLSTLNKKNILTSSQLSDDEKKIWEDIYKVVMILGSNEKANPTSVDTGNFKKSYFSVEASYFDAESASAGQDNLGQIITAIVSFHRLKKELKEAYQGGILLIDEFDATLHPIAQKLLLKKVIAYARILSLQVVTTTHSLDLIRSAFQESNQYVRLLYLQRENQKILSKNNANLDFIESDLACLSNRKRIENIPKTTVLFEDNVAASFFNQITGGLFNSFIKTYNSKEKNRETSISNGVLKNLAVHLAPKNIPEISKMLFVLDPDSAQLKTPQAKNLLVLPGNFFIEKMMNIFLLDHSSDDELWQSLGASFQECLMEYNNIEDDPNLSDNKARKKKYKEWFARNIKNGIFGKCATKIFKIWANNNKATCFVFCNEVLNALLQIHSPCVAAQKEQLFEKINRKFGT